MTSDTWLSMASAPRDGRVIIVIYKDYSGILGVRWGEEVKSLKESWFYSDWSEEAGDDKNYAGWIPCPPYPGNDIGEMGEKS